jgi:regulator of replication initiation timing
MDVKELFAKFDEFEQTFAQNLDEKDIEAFFANLVGMVNDAKFSREELFQIKGRLIHLQEIFSKKKEELAQQSLEAMDQKDKMDNYINNSYKATTNKKKT